MSNFKGIKKVMIDTVRCESEELCKKIATYQKLGYVVEVKAEPYLFNGHWMQCEYILDIYKAQKEKENSNVENI